MRYHFVSMEPSTKTVFVVSYGCKIKAVVLRQRVINLRITLGLLAWETSLSTEFPTHNLS